jgi:prevent-host-death family protein
MTTSNTARTKRIGAAQAKARLSELLARVAYGGDRYVIERRGKPVAALVSVDELERLDAETAKLGEAPKGALALVGMWDGIMTDEEVDEFIAHVYAERDRDLGRPVNLED